LKAAASLLEAGHWDSAYYLAGYAIECGLKACIAKNVHECDFPDKNTVNNSYTHDLARLVRTAGLEQKLQQAEASSDDFKLNWVTVKDWTEDSRYEQRSDKEATAIVRAIESTPSGVLEWVMQHW
jgi:HEPN domain-containing protein